jgi:hypothetical protein
MFICLFVHSSSYSLFFLSSWYLLAQRSGRIPLLSYVRFRYFKKQWKEADGFHFWDSTTPNNNDKRRTNSTSQLRQIPLLQKTMTRSGRIPLLSWVRFRYSKQQWRREQADKQQFWKNIITWNIGQQYLKRYWIVYNPVLCCHMVCDWAVRVI